MKGNCNICGAIIANNKIKRHSKIDFPVFLVMDEPIKFIGDVSRPGLYYLESAQSFPIRGNGFYSQAMINYLLDQEIITSDQIKYVIYASCSIPHDFFNKFVDYCYNNFGEFAKLAINSMIGLFKPKNKKMI